jgi:hypothetical protein
MDLAVLAGDVDCVFVDQRCGLSAFLREYSYELSG